MEHNPHNLQIGEIVVIDREFINGGDVVIDAFTPNKLYATVHEEADPHSKWQTMTYRLTPKTQNNESKKY